MDTFYGRQTSLLNAIDSDGIVYMADIPSDTRVWLNRPKVGIPERKSNRGRIPTESRVLDDEPSPIEVRTIKNELDPSQWVHTLSETLNKENCGLGSLACVSMRL